MDRSSVIENRRTVSAGVVALLIAAGGACAAIPEEAYRQTPDACAVDVQPTPAAGHPLHAPAPTFGASFEQDSPLHAEFADVLPVTALGRPSREDLRQPQTIHQLPADPSSVSLFLFAASCLGALKLGRSARNLHLGHLPDWYHSAAPAQIGRAVAFDPHFAPPALCTLEEPPGEQPLRIHHPRRDLPPRPDRQFFLTVEAPRGPPATCS